MRRLTAALLVAVGFFLTACSYLDPYHARLRCPDAASFCVYRD